MTEIFNTIYVLACSRSPGKNHCMSDILPLKLKSCRDDVAKFFEPSIAAIADAFEKQRDAAAKLKFSITVGLPLTSRYLRRLDWPLLICSMLSWLAALQPVISCATAFSYTPHSRMCTYVGLRVTCTSGIDVFFGILISSSVTRPSRMVLCLLTSHLWSLRGGRDSRMV